jgi:hypothetical protein
MPKTFIQRSREKSPAEKATFAVLGSRGVVRDFFGLTPKEESDIEHDLDRALAVNLQRQG